MIDVQDKTWSVKFSLTVYIKGRLDDGGWRMARKWGSQWTLEVLL